MRTSIRQVAQHASVSPKTVTNVLRGRDGKTSAITRQRVLQVVQELNYVPVASPLQNRHVETRVIGVVFDQVDVSQDGIGLMIYQGLREGAIRHGYDLLMILRPAPDWAPDREEIQFLDRRSDGFIFVAPLRRHAVLEALVQHEVPVVACSSGDVPGGVAHVVTDNEDTMRQAVRHLKDRGHTRIIHIAGLDWNFDERRRAECFGPAMRDEGLTEYSECKTPSSAQWIAPQDALRAVLEHKATAAICCNDPIAVGLQRAATESGLDVPRDLSIISINDDSLARENGLTAINPYFSLQGSAAIEAWIQLQGGASCAAASQITPVHLVERGSVAARDVDLKSRKEKKE